MGDTSSATTATATATDSVGSVSGIVTSDSLLEDPNEYVSSAEQNSGKVSHKKRNIIIGVVIGVICLGIIILFLWYKNSSSGTRKNNKNKNKDNNSTHKDVENNNTINDNDNDTSNEVEE